MKNYKNLILFAATALLLSCKKEQSPNSNNAKTIPVVVNSTNSDLNFLTSNSASLSVSISSDGGSSITDKGVCWNTEHLPTTANSKRSAGSGSNSYNVVIGNLQPTTTYYIRSYVTNAVGTTYGNEVSLITNSFIADIDGNIYDTIKIGNQVWMASDFRSRHFTNGTEIPWILPYPYTGDSDSSNLRYYGWGSANSALTFPDGWKAPSKIDYDTLKNYLVHTYGSNNIGNKLMEYGWVNYPYYWTTTESTASNGYAFTYYTSSISYIEKQKFLTYRIRCIRR